jgi:hypothetical protein
MSRKSKSHPDRMEVSVEEISAIVERTQTGALSAEEHAKLKAAIDTFALITAQLQAKDASVDRLRRMIFGATTESTRNVLGEKRGEPTAVESTGEDEIRTPRPKPPGHGRNAAAAYTGASQVTVAHPTPWRRSLSWLRVRETVSAERASEARTYHRHGTALGERLLLRSAALQPLR